uniref:ArfGAP with dual PH domains 2 n=1 Tax=Callorhinchus milii TaxID=7868 RepID=A0A4W3JR12_CALMI
MMSDRDRNKKELLELLKQHGNSQCADCGIPEPEWASYTLGIFVCLNCSGMHRNLSGISKVKSIRLDFWEDDLVERMKTQGNLVAKNHFEADVPLFYYRPQASDCMVLKDQWIRAKYEREEFTGVDSQRQAAYTSGKRVGELWKRGRDNGTFLKRNFILSQKEGTLQYYVKEAKGPKAVIRVADLNATLQPEKVGNPNGMQISYLKDGRTRNMFVYHSKGKVRPLRPLPRPIPLSTASQLLPRLTRNYAMEGYMEKTGPTQREPFKKRWFTLDALDRRLMYLKDPLDAFAQGEVFIGNSECHYSVKEGLQSRSRGNRWSHGFTLVTPERAFLLTCENEQDFKQWMAAFREIILRPMSAQDYTIEATFRRRQR